VVWFIIKVPKKKRKRKELYIQPICKRNEKGELFEELRHDYWHNNTEKVELM